MCASAGSREHLTRRLCEGTPCVGWWSYPHQRERRIVRIARRKVEEFLWAIGLHSAARFLYQATPTGSSLKAHRRSIEQFYRPLLRPRSLVFDIGANVGVFSSIFASLDTKVIAVEPNADCVRHIQLCYPDIETIQAAVGIKNGLITLHISDGLDELSSASPAWIGAVQKEEGYGDIWKRHMTVPEVTLDALIEHYGDPDYIKIDVEGFEEEVLGGLSRQPNLLSFEFHTDCLDAALRCVDRFDHTSGYNFAFEDPIRFELSNWVDHVQIKKALNWVGTHRYGDVFVIKR